jgi:Zn-dependent metalloprotease
MKKLSLAVGVVGLGLLVGACSSADDPAPLPTSESAAGLAAKLEADLGVPVYADAFGGSVFAMAQGLGRKVAPETDRRTSILAFVSKYARDLGLRPEALRVVAQGKDAAGQVHVRITGLPDGVTSDDEGVDVTTTETGELVAMTGHIVSMDLGGPISAESALEAAKKRLAEDAPDADPTEPSEPGSAELRVEATVEESPRLVYQVLFEGSTVRVDARSGEVLSVTGREAHLQTTALATRHHLPAPYHVENASNTIWVENNELVRSGSPTESRIEVSAFNGFDGRRLPKHTAPLRPNKAGEWDVKTPIPGGARAADGTAVDAMANVALADTFFRKYLLRGPTTSGTIHVVVHRNDETSVNDDKRRNNANFSYATQSIYFGDGAFVTSPSKIQDPDDTLPVALSLDVVGHELAHAFVNDRTPGRFEAGGLDEGVADVVGQLCALETPGQLRRADRHLEESIAGGIRNLSHPERGLRDTSRAPQVNHLDTRRCLALGKNGEPLRDARGRSYLNVPKDEKTPAFDDGCIHANATLVGHAFWLMTYGGSNAQSKVRVDRPVGLGVARHLWLTLLGPAIDITAPPFRILRARTLEDAAKLQVSTATVLHPEAKVSVACAWQAVGVLDAAQVRGMVGAVCPRAEPPSCVGKPLGVYCNEDSPFAYYECKGGPAIGGSCAAAAPLPSAPNAPPQPLYQKLCVTDPGGTDATRSRAKRSPYGAIVCEDPWLVP